MSKHKQLLAALLGVALAGCSPLAPQPDRSKYYILTPLAPAPTAVSDPRLSVGIGPIDFPDYLRSSNIVTRVAPNRLEVAQGARWAEPVDKTFDRTLVENIAELLQTQRIEKYPWPQRSHVDYQVEVAVQRFEATADGQSQLIARWIIKDGVNGNDLYASETKANTTVPAGDTGASEALSSDLGQLSSDIATRLTEIDHKRQAMSKDDTSRHYRIMRDSTSSSSEAE